MSFESLCSAIKTDNHGALDNILCVDPETTIKILRQTDDQNRNALMIIANNFKEEDQKTGERQTFLKDVLEAIKMSDSLDLIETLYSQVDNNGFNVLLSFYSSTDGIHAINQWIPNIGSRLVKKQLAQKTNKGDTALSLAAENAHRISKKEMEICCGQLVMFNLFEEQYSLLSESHKKKLHDKRVVGTDWKPDPRMVSEYQGIFEHVDGYWWDKRKNAEMKRLERINEPYMKQNEALYETLSENDTVAAKKILDAVNNDKDKRFLLQMRTDCHLLSALCESSSTAIDSLNWLCDQIEIVGGTSFLGKVLQGKFLETKSDFFYLLGKSSHRDKIELFIAKMLEVDEELLKNELNFQEPTLEAATSLKSLLDNKFLFTNHEVESREKQKIESISLLCSLLDKFDLLSSQIQRLDKKDREELLTTYGIGEGGEWKADPDVFEKLKTKYNLKASNRKIPENSSNSNHQGSDVLFKAASLKKFFDFFDLEKTGLMDKSAMCAAVVSSFPLVSATAVAERIEKTKCKEINKEKLDFDDFCSILKEIV